MICNYDFKIGPKQGNTASRGKSEVQNIGPTT